MHNPARAEEHKCTEEYCQNDYQESIRAILEHISGSIPLDRLEDHVFLREPHAQAGDDAEDSADGILGPFPVVQQLETGTGAFFANGALGFTVIGITVISGFAVIRIAAILDFLGARVRIVVNTDQSPGDGFPSLRCLVERGFVDADQSPGDGFPSLGSLIEGGHLGFLEHFTERLTHFDHHYPTFFVGPFLIECRASCEAVLEKRVTFIEKPPFDRWRLNNRVLVNLLPYCVGYTQ